MIEHLIGIILMMMMMMMMMMMIVAARNTRLLYLNTELSLTTIMMIVVHAKERKHALFDCQLITTIW